MNTQYDPEDEQQFYDQAEWGVFQSYHRAVLSDILALLPDDAGSILDVGCGDGLLTNELPPDREVVGLDISPVALKFVKRRAVLGSAMELPFEDDSFDLVMANDVVEHFSVEHRQRVLAEMERVARKYVLVTTPFTEKLVRGYRSQPRDRSHVNRHFDSFDVATVAGFFNNFRMTNCVFSGDEWEDELAPVEYLKRAQIGAAAAGSRYDDAGPALDAALERMRTRQAAYLAQNPRMVDMLRRRTEIIGLFERRDAGPAGAGRLDDRAIAWENAKQTAAPRDLLEIVGGEIEDLRGPVLPLASRLPYVVFAGPLSLGGDAATLGEVGPVDIKIGFFAAIAWQARLHVKLRLHVTASVAVNVFDPLASYRNLYRENAEAGDREIVLDLHGAPISQFGHLFQIVVDDGPVEIVHVRIDQEARPQRQMVGAGPDYVSRRVGDCAFYTGLDQTGRLLPLWFEFAEDFPPTPEDLLESPAAIETLMIETALLEGVDVAPLLTDRASAPVETLEAIAMGVRKEALSMAALKSVHASEIISLNARLGQQTSRIEHIETFLPTVERLGRLAEKTTRLLRAPRALAGRVRTALQARRPSRPAPVVAAVDADATASPPQPDGLPQRVTMLVPDDRIDRRVLLEGRTLASRGVAVTVVAVPFPGDVDLDQQQFPDLEIVRIDTSKAAAVERDLRSGRLADHPFDWKDVYFYTHHFLEEALAKPVDLVVAHDLPVLPAAIAAADVLGARLFYDAHELYPEQLHFGERRIELYRAVEKVLIQIPDQVATVNTSIAEEMHRRYRIDEPVVILNAPDATGHPIPYARSPLLRDALKIDPDTRIALFQGSLSLNRNLEMLVEAMAHVATEKLVLVVKGPGETKRRELEGIARELGLLNSKVFFHDAVPQTELLAYTAGADFGIIPYPPIDINTTLCTPNKLFEFFVAGIPILANDLPELRRFVLGKGAGLTHQMNSAAAMARGIERMAASDLASFREAVAASAAGMTWQAQEPVVLEAYRSAMRPKGAAAGP